MTLHEKNMHFAYELAIRKNLKIPKAWELNKQAGVDWLYVYLKCFSLLSIRRPEARYIGYTRGFNKNQLKNFII